MHELRRPRRFGRFLAAWLLLWFCTMGWAPSASDPHANHAAATAVASSADEDAPCPEHEHGTADLHAGHASGSASHCPICSGAAVPSLLTADVGGSAAPSDLPRVLDHTHPRSHTDLSPPARGPPDLS